MIATGLLLLAAIGVADAAKCFTFKGQVAQDGFRPRLGQTILIEWDTDTSVSGCSGVTANTRVKIELWDDDFVGDDLIADLTVARNEGGTEQDIPNTGSFEWTMPYDVTEFNAAGGGNHQDDLYFRISVAANSELNGSSQQFGYNDANAYLFVLTLAEESYDTGATVEYTVLYSGLPDRKFQCYAVENDFIGGNEFAVSPEVTVSGSGPQRKTYSFTPTQAFNDDTYGINCRTTDGKLPNVKYAMPQSKLFRIVKTDFDLKITEPTGSEMPKANTLFAVKWTVTMGVTPTDKVRVQLVQHRFGFIENVIASTYAASHPLASAGSLEFTIPVETTGQMFARVQLLSKPDLKRDSPKFTVLPADTMCRLVAPSQTDALTAGSTVEFRYSCTGFAAGKTAKATFVNENAYGTPREVEVDAQAPLGPGSHTLSVQLPNDAKAGWSWRLVLKNDADKVDIKFKELLVLRANDNGVCTPNAANEEIVCAPASSTAIAVSPQHQVEVKEIRLRWGGATCGPSTRLNIQTQMRVEGVDKSYNSFVKIFNSAQKQSINIGDVASPVFLVVDEMSYSAETRDSLTARFHLSLDGDRADMPIGTVTLPLNMQADCTGVTGMPEPPVIVTERPRTGGGQMTAAPPAETVVIGTSRPRGPPGSDPANGPSPTGTDLTSAATVSMAVGAVLAALAVMA